MPLHEQHVTPQKAGKISSKPSRRITRARIAKALFFVAWTMFLAGCDLSPAPPTYCRPGKTERPVLNVDAGVILADRDSYLCIPLAKLGLTKENILCMSSSCECLQPSLIDYITPHSTTACGVLLRFNRDPLTKANEPGSADIEETAVNLALTIDIALSDGTHAPLTVNLLHTSLSSGSEP